MMTKEFDVAIAGAGPGGVAAALKLAETDLSVILLEKDVFPRDKICGDALSGKVLDALRMIDPSYKESLYQFSEKLDTWGIRFFAPNKRALDIPFYSKRTAESRSPGFISKRIAFDSFLFKLIQEKKNIQIKQNFKVQEARRESGKICLSNGKEDIQAKIVIAADGAQSRLSKLLADEKMDKKHHSAGIRAYYKGVKGFNEENFIELHYLKDLLPGYLWIFPLDKDMANVGLGMLSEHVSKHKINLKSKLHELIENHPHLKERFEDAEMVDSIKGFGLPLGSKKRKISGDNYMLVGDAASLIDPFTGEGISNAMMSGIFAAEWAQKSISDQDQSSSFFQKYDAEVYRRLGKELDLSYKMQKLVRFPWLFNFIVNKANRNPSLRTMFTMMFENLDIRKELSKPSFYWDLIFK
ncbi:MAG: geranylgeranyl reductase family protein [Bacteroidia bacterium]|nr:geranylgeranyl reductase family protein [Bacteroidia bacterium]